MPEKLERVRDLEKVIRKKMWLRLRVHQFTVETRTDGKKGIETKRTLRPKTFPGFSGLSTVSLANHVTIVRCDYPILLCFPGQLGHLPYSFWRCN